MCEGIENTGDGTRESHQPISESSVGVGKTILIKLSDRVMEDLLCIMEANKELSVHDTFTRIIKNEVARLENK